MSVFNQNRFDILSYETEPRTNLYKNILFSTLQKIVYVDSSHYDLQYLL